MSGPYDEPPPLGPPQVPGRDHAVGLPPNSAFVTAPGSPPMTLRPALRRWLWTGGLTVLFLLSGLVFAAGLGMELGVTTTFVGLAASFLPLGIVIPAVLWLDRFEAEPTRYLVTAFLWGACVATSGALLLNTSSMVVIAQVGDQEAAESIAAVLVAPVVEEVLKGLGVLLVLLLRRREFDGVVDGIVYAAIVAAGFAFAENVLYIGRGYDEYGPTGLLVVLVTRGLFSPFAHPMFTACTGVGLGIAAMRSGRAVRWFAPMAGLLVAITLHAIWNMTALLGAEGSLTLYVILQVPLFLAATCAAIWMRRREGRIIGAELIGYARHGWFAPPEVTMLGDVTARREALRWARHEVGGHDAGAMMQRFQDQATELAFLRHRMRRGTAPTDANIQEWALLQDIVRLRSQLYARGGSGPQAPAR